MRRFSFLWLAACSLSILSCLQDPNVLNNEPDAPEIHFDDLTRTSVTLIGSVDNKDPNATYGFIITEIVDGEEKGATQELNIDHLVEDNTFLWTADLAIGATYSARSFVSNGLSRKLSNRLIFTTPSTSKPTLSNVTLVDGFLTASVKDDGGRVIKDVGFIVGDSPERKALLRKGMLPATSVSGDSFSRPLSSFEPGNTLYFIACARDEKEDIGYSPDVLEVTISDQDIVHFEDPFFEEYVVKNFDLNHDDKISYGEIKVIKEIDVYTDNISSVNEISLMPELRVLSCSGSSPSLGNLKSLNLGKNPNLLKLVCDNNLLEELDISDNPLLDTLSCAGNLLADMPIASNPVLDYLDCSRNALTDVDLSQNSGLRHLNVGGNPIESLDLSSSIALKRLICSADRLKTLDISYSRDLDHVDCRENPMDTLFLFASQNPETLLVPEGTVLFYYIGGISLTEDSITVPVGQTHTLTAVLDPEDTAGKDIAWSSSNETIAKVSDEGVVSGIAPGSCIITALCYGRKANCQVSVTIPVSNVSFNESEREVYIGENFSLEAIVTPDDALDKTLTWETSDPTVAIVSQEGAISPVGIGTATIKATTTSGESASFDCIVVSEAPVFPDEHFRKYVYGNFDSDGDGFLTRREAMAVLSIVLDNVPQIDSIETLLGVECFTNLNTLGCSNKRVKHLDISRNNKLQRLWCQGNQLKELDLSQNENLKEVLCSYNQIQSFDITNLTQLEVFDCGNNPVLDLDVSRNVMLKDLGCHGTQITSLNVNNNPNLERLTCYYCPISNLDVSHNQKLKRLYCGETSIASLNVNNNSNLETLSCGGNPLSEIDISNNPNLTELSCGATDISYLDLRHNPKLLTLSCGGNNLTELDITQNTSLWSLDCEGNQLTEIDLSNNTYLTQIYVKNNKLKALDLRKLSRLKYVSISYNTITTLLLDEHPDLIQLHGGGNPIININLTGCPNLESLWIPNTDLTSLNISNNLRLNSVDCTRSNISSIALPKGGLLSSLSCYANHLTELDVRNLFELTYLNCSDNSLLSDIWLNYEQSITTFIYDENVATLHYE